MVAPYEPQDLLIEPVRDENLDVAVDLDYVANDSRAHAPPGGKTALMKDKARDYRK
jgi:hypothetical protein